MAIIYTTILGCVFIMVKKLEECDIGDFVRIWCIGTSCWDDEVVKIVDIFVGVKVQYKSGKISRFSSSTECKVVSF